MVLQCLYLFHLYSDSQNNNTICMTVHTTITDKYTTALIVSLKLFDVEENYTSLP